MHQPSQVDRAAATRNVANALCVRQFAGEPRVAELLCDPIVRALMAADKTDRHAVVALLARVHDRRVA